MDLHLIQGKQKQTYSLSKPEISSGLIGHLVPLYPERESLPCQTFYISEQGPTEVESNESLFFDPSSPFFQHILYGSLGALGLFLVCGLLYQVLFFKRRTHLKCWYFPFVTKLTFKSNNKVINSIFMQCLWKSHKGRHATLLSWGCEEDYTWEGSIQRRGVRSKPIN